MIHNPPIKTFPWRIFTRVVLIQSVLVLVALAASGIAARYFYKKQFLSQLEGKLKDTLTIVARTLPAHIERDWCRRTSENVSLRFTVFAYDGDFICDAYREVDLIDQGSPRPEVEAARRDGFGVAIRHSKTLKSDMYYGAMNLPDRKIVLRASGQLSELYATIGVFDVSLGFVLALFAVLLGIFAVWSGQKLVFPLGRLILKTQSLLSHTPERLSPEEVETDSYGEWSELESNIDDIRRDLEAKARSLDTERVELATIMGSISDAILAVDPDGVPLFFNSRFELLFGRRGLGDRKFRVWEIFREPQVLGAFNAALKEGTIAGTSTIPVEQGSGITRFFSLSVAPLRRQDGTIYGAVGIFHDVSELKSAEQMRIDFVANVSHELRTPLTSIKGYAETLEQDLKQERPVSKEFLEIIGRNANRLMNLMDDLLDLSSIESDHLLQKEDLSTGEMTRRVLKQMAGTFEAKTQTTKVVIREEKVYADENRLEQILNNLLDNANKYTPEGGTITITWERDGKDVVLRISDTGPGIPLEHLPRLFERFYRVDKARSREQGGTGLGLAIVKHIMQRHDGRATVESQPGAGTTFICRFPSR